MPPYTLTIGQDSYRDPNAYVLTMDVEKAFHHQIPYIPSFMWSGFAVTNPTDEPVSRVFLTSYDKDGKPVHTGFGPLTLGPGEKRVFLLEQLPWRKHEFGMIDRLVLKSDAFVNFVHLFGDTKGQSMASVTRPLPRDDRLIIPGAITSLAGGEKLYAQMMNQSNEDTDVTLKLFAESGRFIKQASTTIAPGEKFSIQPGKAPFHYSMSNVDWIEVVNNAGNLMSGFQYVSAEGKAEAVAMPAVTGTRKVVPHIPPPWGSWNLMVSILNPNDAENHIRLHMAKAGEDADGDLLLTLGPREKRMLDIQSSFARPAGDPLHHSMIEIEGDQPFVGWYAYRAPDGGDEAAFPLIDESDHGTELILPHNAGAGGGAWWTGACVGNSSKTPVRVRVESYDGAGRRIPDVTGILQLDPGAYEILTVASFFGLRNTDISFLKFKVDSPQDGRICGFYLYGKLENGLPTTRQLSGGNLGGAHYLMPDLPSGTALVIGPGRAAHPWRGMVPALLGERELAAF
jgi:hypothetical protein